VCAFVHSGKSTLTNVLRHGRLPNSTGGTVLYTIRSASSTGERLNNGDVVGSAQGAVQTLTATQAQHLIGHVPQDDILDRSLTIRELFTFHAKTRSRVSRSAAEIRSIVDDVLADLAIQHVADSIIGGGENAAANISGGQLKRVNIGCELVALSRPALLLLDEPTAGLDAAIAFELIMTLESLKKRGITIFMVIQQPRAEIFERIDHLFLMNSVGGIVYEGRSAQAVPYLLSIGYSPNPDAFDADYCLDVLNGLRDPSSMTSRRSGVEAIESTAVVQMAVIQPQHGESRLDCTELHLLWREQQKQQQQQGGDVEAQKKAAENLSKMGTATHEEARAWLTWEYWQRLGYHTFLNAERLLTIRLRNRTSLLVYIAIDAVMSLALSSGFSIYLSDSYRGVFMPPVDKVLQLFYPSALQSYRTHNAASMGFAQLLFFMSSALGSSSALSAVPVFSGQAILAKRENAAGISVVSFASGRMVGDVFFVTLHGFVFAGVWMLFGHAGHFYNWLGVILSTAFAASGIGYIASATYNQSTASAWAIVVAFISSVFAGVDPNLRQVSRYPVVSWPWYMNFATWTAEATYFTWTRYLLNDGHVPTPLQQGADAYGYKIQGEYGIARSVGAMIALGVGMRLLASWLLYRRVTKD
jgi:ABC-type multidrug transport system ATPase subunit